ncbi:MAG: hypothetical protein Q7R52_05335 [archaeon]|nr:hypothetical protein [archaeon]
MVVLSYLSVKGYIGFFTLLFICLLANFSSDMFLFFFGKKIISRFKSKKIKDYKKLVDKLVEKVSPGKLIFLSKFIYGARTLTVIYMGSSHLISNKKYIILDSIALVIINTLVLSIGYYFAINTIDFSLEYIVIFLGIFFLILYFVKKWLSNKLTQLYLHIRKKKE